MSDKQRLLAPIVMLLAGAVASIAMFVKRYELKNMLLILLLVLVSFYIIGLVFAYVLMRFERQNEEIRAALEAEEGEFFEKEMTEEADEADPQAADDEMQDEFDRSAEELWQ